MLSIDDIINIGICIVWNGILLFCVLYYSKVLNMFGIGCIYFCKKVEVNFLIFFGKFCFCNDRFLIFDLRNGLEVIKLFWW